MPVFETGAFNHSATCPAASQLIRPAKLVQPAGIAVRSLEQHEAAVAKTGVIALECAMTP